MKKKAKASGVNISEAQRGTVQVKLRLPTDVAEDLDDLAARWGLTRSGAVARLLDSDALLARFVAIVGRFRVKDAIATVALDGDAHRDLIEVYVDARKGLRTTDAQPKETK